MAAGNPPSVRRVTGKPNINVYNQVSGGTSTAFYAGDLVKLDANGFLVIATTAAILGIAQIQSPGNTTTEVPVDVIFPDGSLFAARLGSGTCAVTDYGEICDFTFTVGAHTIATNGTNDSVCIRNLDAIGVGTTELVSFKTGALQGATGF